MSTGFVPYPIDGPPPLPPLYGLLAAAESRASGVRFVIDLASGESVDYSTLTLDAGSGETMDEVLARYRSEGLIAPSAGRERWLNGVEVFPYPTSIGDVYDERCSNPSRGAKDEGTGVDSEQFAPIVAYIAETCASFGLTEETLRRRATVALESVESSIVARHLMSGVGLPENPFFGDTNAAILNSGAATSAVNGIALLENAIAATGRGGVIHLTPGLAVAASDRLVLDNRTGVIRTITGTLVVADPGYVIGADSPTGGSSPTPTQEWAYATGPIDVRRSEMFMLPDNLSQALERDVNTVTYRAERYYLADWDGTLQVAVLVDRCRTTC